MQATATISSRPYQEPGIVELLVLASFLLLSNAIDFVLNRLLFCGLVGQILIGVAWGTPGGNLLPDSIQDAVTQLGYLGLILIVYEGGLATNLKALRGDLTLSLAVALIGTSVPIALSFALQEFLSISALQAFAAGASLCSTSLGTTFTVLSASGLGQSRLGVVLTSAAMLDDVVGLIMSGVISSLGTTETSFSAVTVIRPVFVSVAYGILLPLICALVIKPLTLKAMRRVSLKKDGFLIRTLRHEGTAFMLYTAFLLGLITSASYAGTSELFAAYLAGVSTTWWSDLVRSSQASGITDDSEGSAKGKHGTAPAAISGTHTSQIQVDAAFNGITQNEEYSKGEVQDSLPKTVEGLSDPSNRGTALDSGRHVYERFLQPATDHILRPFFFASIGFAIPISQMFSGAVVWRGFVYAVLMVFAKLVCGLCLVPFAAPTALWQRTRGLIHRSNLRSCLPFQSKPTALRSRPDQVRRTTPTQTDAGEEAEGEGQTAPARNCTSTHSPKTRSLKPRSLYPAAILGSAMVARGEIGFLISSIAETDGTFNSGSGSGASESFLVTTWAILLCTIIGPVMVGTLVRRVNRLQMHERRQRTGREDPLGPWGIRS